MKQRPREELRLEVAVRNHADQTANGFAAPAVNGFVAQRRIPVTDRRRDDSPERASRLVDVLRDCPLLFGIGDEDLEDIAAVCTTAAFQPQEQIFAEGESCRGLWLLAEGRVRLYHADAEGRQHVVSFRGPHSPLDLAPALDGRAHSASAVALESCSLVFIPRATLVTLGRDYPITIRNVVDQLCVELRQRDIATAIASLRDARGRICCTLLTLAREYGLRLPGALRIDYRLTRQDVADRSAVTLETAIRVLSDLQRKAIIRTQAQVIDILDLAGLQHSSECQECELDCSVFATPQPRAITIA
jgi:CRP/FNR family transcriptional regulator, cyclic AMP receptor protein